MLKQNCPLNSMTEIICAIVSSNIKTQLIKNCQLHRICDSSRLRRWPDRLANLLANVSIAVAQFPVRLHSL